MSDLGVSEGFGKGELKSLLNSQPWTKPFSSREKPVLRPCVVHQWKAEGDSSLGGKRGIPVRGSKGRLGRE